MWSVVGCGAVWGDLWAVCWDVRCGGGQGLLVGVGCGKQSIE